MGKAPEFNAGLNNRLCQSLVLRLAESQVSESRPGVPAEFSPALTQAGRFGKEIDARVHAPRIVDKPCLTRRKHIFSHHMLIRE
jgi:hypothetical protein